LIEAADCWWRGAPPAAATAAIRAALSRPGREPAIRTNGRGLLELFFDVDTAAASIVPSNGRPEA
jgi:hypothetical protein